MMDDLIARLGLEFEPYFNSKKALAIFIATVLLVFGISCVIKNSLPYQILGSACFIVFIRIVMGSPIESVLTPESIERLNHWLKNDRENHS